MAEGKNTGVKELEEEITCAICHDHYTEPKVLPCCHYYCKQCIRSLALRTGMDKPFSCPECRKDTTLPQGSVDDLPAAFFINRMKEVHSKLERATGKIEATCEICSVDKAEAFCRQCAQFICAECVKSHKRMKKAFPGHHVVTLDELKKGGAEQIVVQEPSLQTCEVHEEPMKIYCFDCSCLICRDCTIKRHNNHNHEFIKVAAPEMKKTLIQHLNPLKERKVTLSHAVKEIQTTKSEVEAQGYSVANHIESSFDQLHHIIEHCKQALLTEAATKVSQKLEHLSGQEKSLSTACAVVQSVIEYTEQCVQYSADDEIMCMHAEIQSQIEREQHNEVKNLEPVEEVDIGVEVNCVKDLKQLCQTKAKITQLPIDPTQCTVTFEGVKNAEVSKVSESSFTFTSKKLTNGKPTKRQCTPECHLKSLANGSTIKCQIYAAKGHEHHIKYTPTVRGRHELTVIVNGQEVAGSPFPVFVSIHPTKLGKPVQVIPQLAYPAGVAINSEGEIIVAERDGDVVTLNREGKRLRSIRQTGLNLSCPRGVTVDEEDNIHFVDQDRTCIYKCDKQMKNVTRKMIQHKQTGNWFVIIIRDEVMVCEQYNRGTVTVYNKELEYVREIASHVVKSGKFTSMSSDEHCNLYVGDENNHRIHVFSNNGDLLRSIGRDGNGINKLKTPVGVCVSGQYVYVTNLYGHNISVFTTEGEYVTSFGQKGSDEGNFVNPWGVCVDKNGYVCVCDCCNNRMQFF